MPDILINSIWGKVLWYKNIGSLSEPRLASAEPITVDWPGAPPKPAWNWWNPEDNHLVTQWRTRPLVIDWNKDGLKDLVMLDHEGFLSFFERTKKGTVLMLLPGKRIFYSKDQEGLLQLNKNIAGGSGRRKICITDWDQDGQPDLLINSRPNVNFMPGSLREKGTYYFDDKGAVDSTIIAGHTTSPTVVDWDKNGIPDLLVGAEDGFFYYLKNPR